MLFPFRTSAIFRNRWVALMWAAGICFTAVQIADGLAGMTSKTTPSSDAVRQDDRAASDAGSTPPNAAVAPDRILK